MILKIILLPVLKTLFILIICCSCTDKINTTSPGEDIIIAYWVKVTPEADFGPRDTGEDAVFKSKMWISNGFYHGGVLTRDLWSSPDGVEWTRINAATPYDGYSELAVFKDKLWAVKSSVWNSTDGTRWNQILETTPFGARSHGEVVVHKNKMWQLGTGNDVWNTENGKDWTCVNMNTPFGERRAAAVAVFQENLWLMGGHARGSNDPPEAGYSDRTTFNDVWKSSDGLNWTRVLEHAPWSARMWFVARAYAGKLWVIGGFDNINNRNLGDVWYTEDGVNWTEFNSNPVFTPRHEPTVYVFDDAMWVVAGNAWPIVNDVWLLSIPES